MKSSSSSLSGKMCVSSSNSKSKKNSKDREKRKSQSSNETVNQHNAEKGSPNKESTTRKYAGYSPEQLVVMAEQSVAEHLTDDVCMAFTEDINYKLRHVIYDSLLKARLSGRNSITSVDIDNTFECLQIEKVYGAPANPHWITLASPDQNLHYLDDCKINLIEIAEEAQCYLQPTEPTLARKWIPETKDVSKNLRMYFVLMCQAVADKDNEMCLTALQDISENNLIGPIIEWFYHFGYFLLSKDITYDSLTLRAFDLIEALESNPISSLIVSDKQIILLARLLLQRLLRSVTTPEILKPMCRAIAILCSRCPIRKMTLKKIASKFSEVREEFAVAILCMVNELGLDAICTIFLPHMKWLLSTAEEQKDYNLIAEILRTYNILCSHEFYLTLTYAAFYDVFAEGLIPIWKNPKLSPPEPLKLDLVWLTVRVQLIKSRRKIPPVEKKEFRRIHIEEAFPEDEDYETERPKICFRFHSFAPAVGRMRFLNMAKFQSNQVQTHVTIGKRTLLAPVLNTMNNSSSGRKCVNHSIMYHNL